MQKPLTEYILSSYASRPHRLNVSGPLLSSIPAFPDFLSKIRLLSHPAARYSTILFI